MSDEFDIFFAGGRHNTALLVRKSLNGRVSTLPLPHNAHRHVLLVQFSTAHGSVAFATFHLQSDFFTEKATLVKQAQLDFVADALRQTGADVAFCAGDANLTGGPHLLRLENEAIAGAKVTDAWLNLHETDESQMKLKWKLEHCTWCGRQNPLVRYRHEHHRPDRVFVVDGTRAVCKTIKRVRGEDEDEAGDGKLQRPYSDHFGLDFVIDLTPVADSSEHAASAEQPDDD